MCTLACPYGGVYISSEKNLAYKCDTCDGKPKCVEACPIHILNFFEGDRISQYVGDEDFLSPGTRACSGCPAELSLRHTLRIVGRGAIFFGAPGCMTTLMIGSGDKAGGMTSLLSLSFYQCSFHNDGCPSVTTKAKEERSNWLPLLETDVQWILGFRPCPGLRKGERILSLSVMTMKGT